MGRRDNGPLGHSGRKSGREVMQGSQEGKSIILHGLHGLRGRTMRKGTAFCSLMRRLMHEYLPRYLNVLKTHQSYHSPHNASFFLVLSSNKIKKKSKIADIIGWELVF